MGGGAVPVHRSARAGTLAGRLGGRGESAHWFDVGRDYTERWLHQQQIRDAVGAPPLTGRAVAPPGARPVRAGVCRSAIAIRSPPSGATVHVAIEGPAGGDWTLRREARRAGGSRRRRGRVPPPPSRCRTTPPGGCSPRGSARGSRRASAARGRSGAGLGGAADTRGHGLTRAATRAHGQRRHRQDRVDHLDAQSCLDREQAAEAAAPPTPDGRRRPHARPPKRGPSSAARAPPSSSAAPPGLPALRQAVRPRPCPPRDERSLRSSAACQIPSTTSGMASARQCSSAVGHRREHDPEDQDRAGGREQRPRTCAVERPESRGGPAREEKTGASSRSAAGLKGTVGSAATPNPSGPAIVAISHQAAQQRSVSIGATGNSGVAPATAEQ